MIPSFPDFIFIDDSSLVFGDTENVVRSQMEVGPPKTRPMACKPMSQIAMAVRICGVTDLKSFKSWFREQLSYGSSWFLMIDPIDGEEKRFRFVNTQIQWSKLNDIYTSQFSLEFIDG